MNYLVGLTIINALGSAQEITLDIQDVHTRQQAADAAKAKLQALHPDKTVNVLSVEMNGPEL